MKKYLLFLLISFNAFATPTGVPSEAWVKLACIGPVTPRGYHPVLEKTIKVFHLKTNVMDVFPTIFELRDKYSHKFKEFTKICTEARLSQMDLSKLPQGKTWLDWDTDHEYSRYQISEEFIYDQNSCRETNKPCTSTSQCCNRTKGARCNILSNTCEGGPTTQSTETY